MKKVVSATLAGALAVGMVPAMALADDAQLETLSTVEAVKAFNNGEVIKYATSMSTPSVNVPATGVEFTASANAQVAIPVWVELENGTKVQVNNDATKYQITYVKAGADGKPSAEEVLAPTEVGTYFAVVKAIAGDYKGGQVTLKFVIKGQELAASIGSVNPTTGVVTALGTPEVEYTAKPQVFGFELTATGADLVEGKDYTVKYYKSGEQYNVVAGSATAPTAVGKYYARLTGIGLYAGKTANIDFEITSFALDSSDTITVAPVYGQNAALPTAIDAINGNAELAKEFKLVYSSAVGASGVYTPTVALVDEKDTDVAISGTVTANVVKYDAAASFTYDDAAWPTSISVDLSEKKTKFDAELIEVFGADGKALDTAKYEAAVTYNVINADGTIGAAAAADDLGTTANKYLVTVTVSSKTPGDYTLGGVATMAVTVTEDVLDADTNVFVTHNGVVKSSIETVYSASGIGTVAVTVNDADGNALTENTDYVVTITGPDGKKVADFASIVNAGVYNVKVTGITNTINDGDFTITVKPVDISAIQATLEAVDGVNAIKWPANYVAGKDSVDAGLKYFVDANLDGKKADTEWTAVAGSSLVKPVITLDGKVVTKMDQVGTYEVSLVLADSKNVNYVVSAAPIKVIVAADLDFVDVPLSHWAHDVIAKASSNALKYMNGYAGTKFFGPDDNLTRAQMVCILFNMAGGSIDLDEIKNTYVNVEQIFSDVDDDAYYALPLYWASEAGVVNGDAGKDTFRPNATITRQEAVAMLANYASLRGSIEVADADAVLATMPDGAKVSGWAKECVAWAVDNKIIGNGGVINPQAKITRAEAAAIAVNYQPAKIA
ncbi:MAG: S-layer homology domain-containing protein [Eggerthellaceae bacterium]|nr:S-layer homology domain-containing protein [Eggerthellaceae bacterium]